VETSGSSHPRTTQPPSAQCHLHQGGGNATTSLSLNPGTAKTLPILLVKLQHHVVRGHAEGPPRLVVLPAVGVVHVRGGHGAVVGVVVDVHGAAVVACHVELDVWVGGKGGWGHIGT